MNIIQMKYQTYFLFKYNHVKRHENDISVDRWLWHHFGPTPAHVDHILSTNEKQDKGAFQPIGGQQGEISLLFPRWVVSGDY